MYHDQNCAPRAAAMPSPPRTRARANTHRRARNSGAAAVATILLLFHAGHAAAAEYGVSTYRVGIMDLSAGMIPPAGRTLVKGLFLYQEAHLDASTADGKIASHTNIDIYAAALFVAHTLPYSILGARWAIGALVPALVADQRARIGPAQFAVPEQTSTVGGLGELELSPCMLGWQMEQFHFAGSLFLYAPTGSYDKDRIGNTGLNRWTVEPDAALSWIDAKSGLEASLMLGYTISSENSATHYRSGDEFHADYVLAKHFATGTLFGAAGYALQQTTGDSGSGDAMGPFRSRVLALGPIVSQTAAVGETPVTFSLKYEIEFAAQNFSTGNALWFSAAMVL